MKWYTLSVLRPLKGVRDDWELDVSTDGEDRVDGDNIIENPSGCYFPETMTQDGALRALIKSQEAKIREIQSTIDMLAGFIGDKK